MPIWFLVQLRWGCGLFMFQAFFFFQRKLHVLETVMWLQTFSFSLIWFKIAYKYPVYKVLNSELPHYISLPMILLSINLITNSTKFKISGHWFCLQFIAWETYVVCVTIPEEWFLFVELQVVLCCHCMLISSLFKLHVSISHF